MKDIRRSVQNNKLPLQNSSRHFFSLPLFRMSAYSNKNMDFIFNVVLGKNKLLLKSTPKHHGSKAITQPNIRIHSCLMCFATIRDANTDGCESDEVISENGFHMFPVMTESFEAIGNSSHERTCFPGLFAASVD